MTDQGRDIGGQATAICPGGVRGDLLDGSSRHHAEKVIDAYRSVYRVEDALTQGDHRQGGDPREVADEVTRYEELNKNTTG